MRNLINKVLPKSIIRVIKRFKNGNYCYFLFLFPIKKNKIVFCSNYGSGYGDNGKYIVEEIVRQKMNYDIVWILKRELIERTQLPEKIRITKYGSLKALYELATAKIWIDNSRKTIYPPKRKNQFYIQTWHSPLRLKKIEKDAESTLSREYIENAKRDSKNCDLMISGCNFSWEIYRNSFWYDGEILKLGTPRCDLFFSKNRNKKEKVIKALGLKNKAKLILYAPTFRNKVSADFYIFEYEKILEALKIKFGGEWKLLIRLHPNVASLANLIEYNNNVINATSYDDMQELLCASDILITDYSSSMFDMAIAGKVCFLYGKDVEEYRKKEREMYFDFSELPFDFAESFQELNDAIMNFNEEEYTNKIRKFFETIGLYENGTASKQLVSKIKLIIDDQYPTFNKLTEISQMGGYFDEKI
jgi:CDP-glycerol glycerophosphotransferase